MPSALTYAAQWVAVTFFSSSILAGSIAYVSLYIGFTAVASKLFGPKIPGSLQRLGNIALMRRSAISNRSIVYGQAALSGPIVYNNLSGTNREYLWYVIALAEGEVEDLVSVWLDGDVIPKADIDWSAAPNGLGGTGDVSIT